MRTRRVTTHTKQYKSRSLVEWSNLPPELLLLITDHLSVSNKLMVASACNLFRSVLIPTIPKIGNTYISYDVGLALRSVKPGIVITDNIYLMARYLAKHNTLVCDMSNWVKSSTFDYSRYERVVVLDGEELLLSKVPVDPYNNIVSQCNDTYILLQTDIYDKQIDCPVSYVYFRDYKPHIRIREIPPDKNFLQSLVLALMPEDRAVFLALANANISPKGNEAVITYCNIIHNKSTVTSLSALGILASKKRLKALMVCKYIDDITELKRILAVRCEMLVFVVYDSGNYIKSLIQLIDIAQE